MLGLARALAELLKRVKQPPVVGELMAGLVLGPTVLGKIAPGLQQTLFPDETAPMHLLETVSWLGMLLLMLLTGMETDVRLLRHLGRPAFYASAFGMLVPFASGWALGLLLPEALVPPGVARGLLAAFLATAMAISAMPVISRILIDLRLVRRNIGVLILSAGVVDDTTGWLILSLIAGAATGGLVPARFALTVAALVAFLLAARYVLFPLMSRLLRFVDDELLIEGSDITAIVTLAFGCAALTQAMGVHAVFGAFVAGLVVRQAPRLRPESIQRIESVVLSVFSPLFFAFVGLKVDLWSLPGPGLLVAFVGVATGGKLVGCYLGGRLGRMSRWESLALGVGMNARGAMELVVATLGLGLGILDERLFSALVVVALTTSIMAPLLLAPIARRLPMGPEEQARVEPAGRAPLFSTPVKLLAPTFGGLASFRAAELAMDLARNGDSTCVVLAAEEGPRRLFTRRGGKAAAYIERLRETAKAAESRVVVRVLRSASAGVVRAEAARGYGLVVVGTTGWPYVFHRHEPVGELARGAPCPVAVLRPRGGGRSRYTHLLVPTDGSFRSRMAVEVAIAYCAATGARLTVLHVMERPQENPLLPRRGIPPESARQMVRTTLERSLAPLFEAITPAARPLMHVQVLESSSVHHTVAEETNIGPYDLLVLHSSAKAVRERLFFGYGNEFLVEEAACSVLVVIPGEEG